MTADAHVKRPSIFWIVFALCFGVDLVTKTLITHYVMVDELEGQLAVFDWFWLVPSPIEPVGFWAGAIPAVLFFLVITSAGWMRRTMGTPYWASGMIAGGLAGFVFDLYVMGGSRIIFGMPIYGNTGFARYFTAGDVFAKFGWFVCFVALAAKYIGLDGREPMTPEHPEHPSSPSATPPSADAAAGGDARPE